MARYLILIGNSEYEDKSYDELDYVKNDVNELSEFLSKYGDFDTIFSFNNCKYDKIRKFLTRNKKEFGPSDDMFFYFSGHGELDKGSDELNLICTDTEENCLSATSINSDVLREFLKQIKSKSKIVILDCCHSGAIINKKSKVSGNISEKDFENARKHFLGNDKGTYMITSSKKHQESHKGINKSIFTECLLNGLKSEDVIDKKRNVITLSRLWEYIDYNIDKSIQVPVHYAYGEGNIYISKAPRLKKYNKNANINKEIQDRNYEIEKLRNEINIEQEDKIKIKSEMEEKNKEIQNELELWKNKVSELMKQNEPIKKPVIKFKKGSYVQFGSYYNEPILWKCMKVDDNGFLLVSEYIICLKAFDAAESGKVGSGNDNVERYGSNDWENSNIRKWLNSDDNQVNYRSQPPTKNAVWDGYNAYADEPGFLTNFKSDEVTKINDYEHIDVNDSDKIFLLSKYEIEGLWSDKKSRIKRLTKSAVDNSEYKSEKTVINGEYWYFTRTPSSDFSINVYYVNCNGSIDYWDYVYYGNKGVVPALYLSSDICKSGKGSKKEPFIV